jgi:SAM-dependent methyltransferase
MVEKEHVFMYPELISSLRCPACTDGPLGLIGSIEEDGEIIAGALRCTECGDQSPIIDGIWDTLHDRWLPVRPAQIVNYAPLTARVYEPLWRWRALSLMSGERLTLGEELGWLRESLDPQAGEVYVDVACSAGLYARALATPDAIVAGVDHAWSFVREARRRALNHGLRISFVRGSAQMLPFRDGAAAGAAMGGSLNEIGDQARAIEETRRILRADGRFFCMSLVRAGSSRGRLLQRAVGGGGIVFPSVEQTNQWFTDAGFESLKQWQRRVVLFSLLRAR